MIEIKDVPDHMFSSARMPGFSYEKAKGSPIFFSAQEECDSCESDSFSMASYLEQCEHKMLEKVLKKCGSTHKAAQALQMSQSTVARRKEKYNIQY
ncbi:hypothetical protein SDC9_102199 [bioreactor metagenome]|uniref:TyrR-like helix-turn-helix domain-containing protein n=1 Tax=bioreactor metagenome TaxID=1076179 RepID=A0A645AQ60_9ZZZZ